MKTITIPAMPLAAILALASCSVNRPQGPPLAAGHLEMGRSPSLGTAERAAHYLEAAEESTRLLASPAGNEGARRSYNESVTGLVTLLDTADGRKMWNRPLALSSGTKTYQLDFTPGNRKGIWSPDDFTSFVAPDQVRLKNLRPNRRDGIGGTLVGTRKTDPAEPQTPAPGVSAPVTAVLDFKGTKARLTLADPTEISRTSVSGAGRDLAADFSAPLAWYPRTSEAWNGIMGALRVDAHLGKTGLYMLQPYDPDRIPVVFVHGLISTPQMWRNTINEISRDPVLRERYQYWVFAYPTGNPPAYSALRLREELAKARQLHPGMKDFVLVGHSMGGIVSRMQATTFDRRAWDAIGRENAAALFARATKGSLVERACIFDANPHVSRLVFICTPHRGSEMALSRIGGIGRSLIALPVELTTTATATMGDTLSLLAGKAGRLPNSVTGLSPANPMLKVLDSRPIEAPYHSIIGDRGKGDSPLSSDGVVKYWSSHLSGSRTERVVPGPHGACGMPETIAELERILHEHLAE